MNTQIKPVRVLRCTVCKDVFEKVGDTSIRLIKPVKVPMDGTKASEGKCPTHDDKKGEDGENERQHPVQ